MPPGTSQRWRWVQRTLVGRLKQDQNDETDLTYRIGGGNGWDLSIYCGLATIPFAEIGWLAGFHPVWFFGIAVIGVAVSVMSHWPWGGTMKEEDEILEDWLHRVEDRANHGP